MFAFTHRVITCPERLATAINFPQHKILNLHCPIQALELVISSLQLIVDQECISIVRYVLILIKNLMFIIIDTIRLFLSFRNEVHCSRQCSFLIYNRESRFPRNELLTLIILRMLKILDFQLKSVICNQDAVINFIISRRKKNALYCELHRE